MALKEGVIAEILYKKDGGEVADRTIIPVHLPYVNVKAIDVGDYSELERQTLSQRVQDYKQYVVERQANILKFEDWFEYTFNKPIEVKWRTYKPSGITEK